VRSPSRRRINRFAQVLASAGLGHRRERSELAGHESGQDHVAIYLRNGNEWIETWLGAYRARTVPMNVNYRYVDEELLYLLNDSQATAWCSTPTSRRSSSVCARAPRIELLIQVADDSGNAPLDGVLAYEDCLAAAAPTLPGHADAGRPVCHLHRWHDGDAQGVCCGASTTSSCRPWAAGLRQPRRDDVVRGGRRDARNGGGLIRLLMIPPFMHGAAQWGSFHAFTNGSAVVIPDDVTPTPPTLGSLNGRR
jgi:fatty-acyl-CoA synthase